MHRFLIAVLVLIGCLAPGLVWAGEDYTGAEYLAGRLMVNFTDGVGNSLSPKTGDPVQIGVPSVDELLARYHVTEMRRVVEDKILEKMKIQPDFYRLVVLLCPDKTDILAMLKDFEQNPNVDYAQPDLLARIYDTTPNDPLWSSQWDKVTLGLPTIWDFSIGSRNVMCVAIDVGCWWKHPDLRGNLWVNPGEDINHDGVVYTDTTYPGDQADVNGVDDDDDGKVDDLIGWDFLQGPLNPPCWPGEDCDQTQDNNTVSLEDHGTHVLGIMGAAGNNGVGVTGVNWNVKAIASRSGYAASVSGQMSGLIVASAAIGGMAWAVVHSQVEDAHLVINMSYGSISNNPAEQNAITSAWNNGAILCGAAGNDGPEGENPQWATTPHYPGACANVVCVGSTAQGDVLSGFTCRGTWVDLYSPGSNITSTVIPGYRAYDGTSMASPNAAGTFALLWSMFPDMTNQELVDLVMAHCKDIQSENPTIDPLFLGNGRIDPVRAAESLRPGLKLGNSNLFNDTDGDGRLESGETASMTLEVRNDSAWSVANNVQVTVTTDDPNIELSNATFSLGTIAPGTTASNTANPFTISVPGTITEAYWAALTANITADGFSAQRTFAIRVGRPQTLIIADDGTSNFHSYFTAAMVGQGYYYNNDVWSTQWGEVTANVISDYQVIIWVCGNELTNTLTANDQAVLTAWLNTGGKSLLLAGQGIDPDISSSAFYSDVLHCQSMNALGGVNLDGVNGDPISNGTTLFLLGGGCGGNGTVHPSKINPINGAVSIYDYDSTGVRVGSGAIRFSNDTYKIVYFSCAIEASCGLGGSVNHAVVLRRVMDWFGAHQTGAEPRQTSTLPSGYSLKANYPNPFNPTTTLTFELPRATHVYLAVYDLLGREVAVLASGTVPAGQHLVTFDGSNLASGTYLAHLQADNYSATQKMMLLK
jgi:hypothetical protein